MTKEEAILILKVAKHGFAAEKLNEALDMAIKALEQEPRSEWEHDHTLLKVYSNGVNDILDKIRDELLNKAYRNFYEHINDYTDEVIDLDDALEIIDKYRVESEYKELAI